MGHTLSVEAKTKVSNYQKELWASRPDSEKGEIREHLSSICVLGGRATLGRKRTPEERAAISQGRKGKGRPQSSEVRAKIAATLRGRKRLAVVAVEETRG
jgi:hypothetical protein